MAQCQTSRSLGYTQDCLRPLKEGLAAGRKVPGVEKARMLL
jgi:hypothetical protein